MASLFIGCGTYDGSVLCYEYDNAKFESGQHAPLKLKFVDPEAHGSSVRSVAFTNQLMISGSTDEYIKLFSLSHNSKLGMLDLHSGTVNKIVAHSDSSHFLTCSTDCTIALWRSKPNGREFECIRHLTRHKDSVESITLHPSGKLALSISRDKTLRVWDLMHGRQAYASRVKLCGNDICFNTDGSRYAVLYNSHIDVFHISKPQLECAIQLSENLNAFEFIESDICAVVADKMLTIYKIGKKLSIIGECDLSTNKIRSLKFITYQHASIKLNVLVTLKNDAFGSVVSGYLINLPIKSSTFQLSDSNRLFSHSQPHIRITCLSVCFIDPLLVKQPLQESSKVDDETIHDSNPGETSESDSSDDESSNSDLNNCASERSDSSSFDSNGDEPAAKKTKISN